MNDKSIYNQMTKPEREVAKFLKEIGIKYENGGYVI